MQILVLVVINLPIILFQVVELLSSVLMKWSEVYASRMMLLLAALVSAIALSRYSSWSCHSLSSLLVVKLISVERMDSSLSFFFLLIAVFSGFNYLLSAFISSKKKTKDFFLGPDLASKKVFSVASAVLWLFLSQSDTTCWEP
jgi:hypothetical protein